MAGIRGHGVAWGDVDGDGWPVLVASFMVARITTTGDASGANAKLRISLSPG